MNIKKIVVALLIICMCIGMKQYVYAETFVIAGVETILDIEVPLDGIKFNIGADREVTSQDNIIKNNSAVDIDVVVTNIEKTGSEPDLIEANTYTDEEWKNLSKEDTLSKLSLSFNGKEIYKAFNNTEKLEANYVNIGTVPSLGELNIETTGKCGKYFGNTEDMSLNYVMYMEFMINETEQIDE